MADKNNYSNNINCIYNSKEERSKNIDLIQSCSSFTNKCTSNNNNCDKELFINSCINNLNTLDMPNNSEGYLIIKDTYLKDKHKSKKYFKTLNPLSNGCNSNFSQKNVNLDCSISNTLNKNENISSKQNKDYSYIKFRKSNYFLSQFSPRFLKKESIDKMIIRRFKKYLNAKLFNIGNAKNKKRRNENMNIDNNSYSNCSTSCSSSIHDSFIYSYYDTISFLNDLVRSKYTPPFNINDVKIKSYNTHYLIWLFSSNIVCYYYELFVDDCKDIVFNKIIKDYNIVSREPEICGKLKYYINNLTNVYRDSWNILNYSDILSNVQNNTNYKYTLDHKSEYITSIGNDKCNNLFNTDFDQDINKDIEGVQDNTIITSDSDDNKFKEFTIYDDQNINIINAISKPNFNIYFNNYNEIQDLINDDINKKYLCCN